MVTMTKQNMLTNSLTINEMNQNDFTSSCAMNLLKLGQFFAQTFQNTNATNGLPHSNGLLRTDQLEFNGKHPVPQTIPTKDHGQIFTGMTNESGGEIKFNGINDMLSEFVMNMGAQNMFSSTMNSQKSFIPPKTSAPHTSSHNDLNGAHIKKEYEHTNVHNTTNFSSSCPQMNPFLFHQMYLQNPTLFQNPIAQMSNSVNSFSNALLNLPPWHFKKHNGATINSPIESSLEEHYGSTSSSPSSPSHLHDSFEPSMGDQKSIKRTYKTDGTKTRKSGFQAGVTVGYTYDAFFISDGRSKRRKLNGKTPSNPKTVDEFNTASSASSSSESSVLLSPPSSTNQTANSLSLLQVTNEDSTHKNSRYTCYECGKNYATSSNLSRHKQTHRSLDSKLAKKCPHCGKAYVSMPALSMHILTHDLKHRCDICGKAFSRPWLLQGHRRAHTGEKPYGCAHCGRAFADRSNLRAHMQIHSQMKQFECKVCHKGFALKSYLNKHMEFSCNDKVSKEFSLGRVESQPNEEDKTEPKSTKSNNLPLAMSIAALVGDDV